MQENPLVTIICLCYNHEKFVIEALNSILNQTYKNLEIVIVDDSSSDNSVAVINQWIIDRVNIKFIANKENIGNTKSFNNAFKLSKGEFIIDFATDDILYPNFIDLLLKKFQTSSFKNLAIVYGNFELVDENKNHIAYYFPVNKNLKRSNPEPIGDIYIGLLNLDNNVCSVTSMIKREIFEEFNCYDESLAYEDYDFWIKVSRKYNFDFIDELMMQKRELSTSLSAQRLKKFNSKTRNFNKTTFKIVLNILKLNKTKLENKAVLKRIYSEMDIAYRTIDIVMYFKYLLLLFKMKFILKVI